MNKENDEMSQDEEMVTYAKELLSDCRFQSVAGCIARHYSGDEGYHSVPQLFWGALRHGDEFDDGNDESDLAARASTDERLAMIDESLRIIKDCLIVLSRSKRYEEAIGAHRALAEAAIGTDCLRVRSDNTNRLVNIEDKLDLVLECLVVLTARDFCEEIAGAKKLLESRGEF